MGRAASNRSRRLAWWRSATRADDRRYNPGIAGGMNMTMTRAAALSAALVAILFSGLGVEARQSAQDLAVKLSGTWVFNRDLSSGFGGAGRGGRGPRPAAR